MGPPTQPDIPSETAALVNRIDSEYQKWRWLTLGWLVVYVLVIIATIVFPIIVASKDSLAKSVLGDIGPFVPLLALATAIVVALDQLLHVLTILGWYQGDRDDARRLLTEIDRHKPTSQVELDEYGRRWDELDVRHGTHRVGALPKLEPKSN